MCYTYIYNVLLHSCIITDISLCVILIYKMCYCTYVLSLIFHYLLLYVYIKCVTCVLSVVLYSVIIDIKMCYHMCVITAISQCAITLVPKFTLYNHLHNYHNSLINDIFV